MFSSPLYSLPSSLCVSVNVAKTQFLIQECVLLISKPNFISSLCYAIDNPLHYQKVKNTQKTCSHQPAVVWTCMTARFSHERVNKPLIQPETVGSYLPSLVFCLTSKVV